MKYSIVLADHSSIEKKKYFVVVPDSPWMRACGKEGETTLMNRLRDMITLVLSLFRTSRCVCRARMSVPMHSVKSSTKDFRQCRWCTYAQGRLGKLHWFVRDLGERLV